jgi:hypothetical protein
MIWVILAIAVWVAIDLAAVVWFEWQAYKARRQATRRRGLVRITGTPHREVHR